MDKTVISILGLGYVGLPLAVAFAQKYQVVGFDISDTRVAELKNGHDHTLEVENHHLQSVLNEDMSQKGLFITSDTADLKKANIHIVTVPTPTDKNHQPILTPLEKAS
jgi:UDP-N-acetyl-D-galactosamine dehydrogenase